ncbi:MAG: Methyl-directed repair adenine methylase, partial [Labilithrix sp.]|nr:Methyl-directed repair adenine methylase [Labilithrix sp.]
MLVAPRPVVKWAGGKSRLLDRLMKRLPAGRFPTYAEPFCGGAAMFFALAAEPKRRFDRALLADKNEELVELYRAIKTDVESLIDRVRGYQDDHFRLDDEKRRAHFYDVRALETATMKTIERGARLLFLNKTCFNGLWRVNASGRFNVPFGKYARPRILDVEGLRAAHEALSLADVQVADFADVTKKLKAGDFAYFDPPYVPVSKTANFTAYASDRFGPEEQERLADELAALKKRRVNAMLSNAATLESRALYLSRGFVVDDIQAARAINSDPSKRGDVTELVVTTYAPAKPARQAKP